MRAVLDPNVLVSAAISRAGPPRQIIGAWVDERFELIASTTLLEELADVLARPKFRRFISIELAAGFVNGLAQDAEMVDDPRERPAISADPDDDYLIALARAANADYLVSGDRHLLDVTEPDPPVLIRASSSTCSTPDWLLRTTRNHPAAGRSVGVRRSDRSPWEPGVQSTEGRTSARHRTQPALPVRLRPQDQTLLRTATRPLRRTARPSSRRPAVPAVDRRPRRPL